MPFPYYQRLSKRDQATYRKSDQLTLAPLTVDASMKQRVADLADALAREHRRDLGRAAQALTVAVLAQLKAGPVEVKVLAARPSGAESELHGLYELEESGEATIKVWMRTAAKKRAVAFRTFVRTLLHEICHHLDLTHLSLRDTFHTEGFFRRESQLTRQLIGEGSKRPAKPAADRPTKDRQLALPF